MDYGSSTKRYGDYILDDKNVKNEFEAENKVKELFMNGSDPDLNMKLWNMGIRIFKGINNFTDINNNLFGNLIDNIRDSRPENTFLVKATFRIGS